jgi:phosphatidylglycerol lysyltransferase
MEGAMADADREHLLALLRRFGWNATSFQCLQPQFEYWFEGADSCVAYVDTGRAWVAAGAPICAEERLASVADSFAAAARAEGRKVVLFGTEQRFEVDGFERLLIGSQPVWDPLEWAATLQRNRNVREQLRRARAKGVAVAPVPASDLSDESARLRRGIEGLIDTWRDTKPMPPMGFLVRVDPFCFAAERRLFVAQRESPAGKRVVGFAAVVPVYARGGWFLENLIRAPEAPNGTTELLVHAAISDAAERGSRYFTLGLSPLSGELGRPLTLARRYGSSLYDFAGLEAFKAKFDPAEWSPIYLSYPRSESAHSAVYHSLVAFSRHGLLRYGIETFGRGPDVVLRLLTALLVPWTALLASVDGSRWFPWPWLHWAWVAFDVALFAALFSLSMRHRAWLSRMLLGFLSLDALLTTWQALAFNLPRIETSGEALVVGVAVLAPSLAALALAGAHQRLARLTEPDRTRNPSRPPRDGDKGPRPPAALGERPRRRSRAFRSRTPPGGGVQG